ncbi:MAG: hypothetical protein ABI158_03435 [Edaphobacter sp.]
MHTPALPSAYQNPAASQRRSFVAEFLLTHPLLPVLRSVFVSSILWIALAFALYAVYMLILNT